MAATDANRRSTNVAYAVRLRDGRTPFAVVVLALAASLAGFVPLAIEAWQKEVFAWDKGVSQAIHEYENRETILDLFDPFSAVLHPLLQLLGLLVVIVVLLALAASGRPRASLFIALGVGGTAVLAPILKEVFERPPVDPNGHGFSFPSGHAMRSSGAVAALTVAAWPTRWRWGVGVVGATVVALTGIAVVYHEWHWASDVLAGWCLSIAWLSCVWLALRLAPEDWRPAEDRRRVEGPTSRAPPRRRSRRRRGRGW